ncbi:MAG: sulfite dehydrogenase [Limnobacter sp.]|uniref:sulfite dehydrogenase n=1 Tax=Limnobacter sp. TaxID=2003368 RepID=UPI0022C616EA|nr:sulfite dehydrogenase [Limnobacter sp.]MCZ8015574.1 sulfite dehydrogenase [Limnobacter sp.]
MSFQIPSDTTLGRIQRAPENFVSRTDIAFVNRASETDRRSFFKKAFAAAAVGAVAASPALATAAKGDPAILNLPAHTKGLGQPVAAMPYGMPSQYEKNLQRRESPGLTRVGAASVSFCPLQGLFGVITPSGLHFERHHQGWWDIDPTQHRLMINGLVKREMVFTIDEIMRMESVSRVHFIECGANSGMEWANVAVPTVQYTHGMLSCSEFTGVPLIKVLEYCGVDLKKGRYILAEGADGSSMTRTIPMEMVESGEVLLTYGQNGEMLRPENGYPLRLIVPGVQGVSSVKYLRRIEVGDKPYAAKDEAVHYVDLMPDGTHRQYTSIQECKSVITTPSGGQKLLTPGFYNITGLAWSGRGKITAVDVSTDGGKNWKSATVQGPVHDKSLTRFNLPWVWDGKGEVLLQSRAVDSTGYVQPSYRTLREKRDDKSIYHNNAIQSWRIDASGEVHNVHVG